MTNEQFEYRLKLLAACFMSGLFLFGGYKIGSAGRNQSETTQFMLTQAELNGYSEGFRTGFRCGVSNGVMVGATLAHSNIEPNEYMKLLMAVWATNDSRTNQ